MNKPCYVRFYAQDTSHRTLTAKFRSEYSAIRFCETYQYVGEFNRFNWDVFGEEEPKAITDRFYTHLGYTRFLRCDNKSFLRVYGALYPHDRRIIVVPDKKG